MTTYDAHGYLGHNPEFTSYGLQELISSDDWLRLMDACEIQGALVAPPSAGSADNFYSDMELIARAIKSHPLRFFGYTRVKPRRGKAALDDIRYWIEERGMHAVKMNTKDESYRLDDRALIDPVLETIMDLKVPILFHTGDTHAKTCTPKMVADLAKDFPNIIFIIGHMGYPGSENELITAMQQSPNTVTESASVFRRVIIQNVVDKIGTDRILMGTNGPYSPIAFGPLMFRDFMPSLSIRQRTDILGGNLEKILGLK